MGLYLFSTFGLLALCAYCFFYCLTKGQAFTSGLFYCCLFFMYSLFRLEQMSAAQLFAELTLSLDECGNIIATPTQYGGAVTHLSYHHYKQKFVANWSKIKGQNYGISQTEVGDIIAKAINKMAEANPLWIFEHSKNASAGIKVPQTAISYVY